MLTRTLFADIVILERYHSGVSHTSNNNNNIIVAIYLDQHREVNSYKDLKKNSISLMQVFTVE